MNSKSYLEDCIAQQLRFAELAISNDAAATHRLNAAELQRELDTVIAIEKTSTPRP